MESYGLKLVEEKCAAPSSSGEPPSFRWIVAVLIALWDPMKTMKRE
ncbi:hypothetical protein MPNT_120068 [Candidatus Methylacidithermus pantelleriae]|uniref:Uncharacterized protein n=1 Tax=Candidatus Methylacidithermus pantelleriae TaxID=2744239 RepID=A0A8J2FN36_9BACT|nr:hypothetical protein MPNT_120068 [Candidatus Methylacidithermus pantelleriae]